MKTDYDDFKDLSFFLDQQTKAEAMLREVEEFKKSFVMSKMISVGDWVQKNPTKAVDIFCGVVSKLAIVLFVCQHSTAVQDLRHHG